MKTVFAARLERHASDARSSPAWATPEREITYAELLARVQGCAAWLASERYAPAGVVGVAIADEIPHLVTSLALLSLGIPHVCLPTYDPVAKKLNLAERLSVRSVVATDPQHALPGTKTLLLTPRCWEATADGALPDLFVADPDAPAIYSTSSGTTGESKIFSQSQRDLAWRAEQLAEADQLGPGARWLPLVSIEYPVARIRRLAAAYLGFTSVFPNDGSSSHASLVELCVNLRVTSVDLSALQVSSFVHDVTDARPLPSHTIVRTVGSPVPVRLRQQFKSRFGRPLFINYGTLEFGRISSTFPDPVDDDLESVGMPFTGIDLEIVDGDDKLVPAGEIGEVRVRSECMPHEYYRDSVATARHFKDGWFYPRDLGSLTPRGALCLYGRSDDMINLNGIKIFPAEIERVLEDHPAVKSAAAFAKASGAYGDIPIAAVELHESAGVGAEELLARARELLGVRAPRKILVLDSLPRNSAGKILKRELAGLLVPGK